MTRSVSRSIALALLFAPLALPTAARADGPGGYRPFKSSFEQAWEVSGTPAERSRLLRTAGSIYYGRNVDRAFGASLDLDPDLPGVRETFLKTATSNRNLRKGSVRELRLAAAINGDVRFDLTGLGERVVDPDTGRMVTDRDIAYRHRLTGQSGRIEVKDVSPESQRRNRSKYERQIRKIAAEGRRTGNPQSFVNRRAVTPELRAYAEARGIAVYENVRTGRSIPRGHLPVDHVLNDLGRRHVRASGALRTTGAGGLAGGVFTAGSETWAVWGSYGEYAAGRGTFAQVGHHGTMALAGGAEAAAGAALLYGSASLAAKLGIAGAILALGAEGFAIYDYASGGMTTREFAHQQANLGGGLAGGIAGGAAAGALAGWAGGPAAPVTVPVAAVVGGVAGGWAAATAADAGVSHYYSLRDAAQERALFNHLKTHYAAE